MRSISQEAVKVAGQVLSMAGDVSAARRVVVEAAGWLCDVEGVKLVDDVGLAPVVADVFGDVDWQATATAAGWLAPDAAGDLLAEVEAAREAAADSGDAAEAARLQRELFNALDQCENLRASYAALDVDRKHWASVAAERERQIAEQATTIADLRDKLSALMTAPAASVAAPAVPPPLPAPAPVKAPAAPVKSAAPVSGDDLIKPDSVSQAAWDAMSPQIRRFAVQRASR